MKIKLIKITKFTKKEEKMSSTKSILTNVASKFNLPKRIVSSIKDLEKKIMSYPVESKIKSIRDKYQDQKENRELVVVDKFGNRYYQYYSHHGLPTKRIIHLNQTSFNKWNDDPFMMSWLQRRRLNPPTQEELEKMYIEQEEFQRRCMEWDKKEQMMIDEFKKRKNDALEKERKETKSIGEGENFKPGVWERTQPLKVDENESKELVEGVSRMPGKYISDMLDDDEKWMRIREKKMFGKMEERLSSIKDLSIYSEENMTQRYYEENFKKRKEIKNKMKQYTNLGKKMIEKDLHIQTYAGFRSRFRDIFKEFEEDNKHEMLNEKDNLESLEKEFSLNKN